MFDTIKKENIMKFKESKLQKNTSKKYNIICRISLILYVFCSLTSFQLNFLVSDFLQNPNLQWKFKQT